MGVVYTVYSIDSYPDDSEVICIKFLEFVLGVVQFRSVQLLSHV